MPRFAAIDVGSNASRLLVVEADRPGATRVLSSTRTPLRLGHGVFQTGRLDDRTIEAAVETLRIFADKLEDDEVDHHRAVVTAAARDAENAAVLLGRVRAEAGINLEPIDGAEEARLVRLAVQRAVPLKGSNALLMDLGGGSLELSIVQNSETRWSTSLPIGTVRLLEAFIAPGEGVQPHEERLLREYLERVLAPVVPILKKQSFDFVVGTGGNFETIAEIAPLAKRDRHVDLGRARKLLSQLAPMKPSARGRKFHLRSDRADVIVPALYAILSVVDVVKARTCLAPGVGLKDGIIDELVGKYFRVWDYRSEEDAIVKASIQLGRRYHFDEAHALQVDRMATALFDQTKSIHNLGSSDRNLLRVAALLHDIGDFVHYASHHKHTQYIIEHSDLMGVSAADRVVVGCVARYHRRAAPSTKHTSFSKLDVPARNRVRKLAAILRIADALDREHQGKVRDLSVRLSGRTLTLKLRGDRDVSLEEWTLARKATMFEKLFRRRVSVDTVSTKAGKARLKSQPLTTRSGTIKSPRTPTKPARRRT